MAKDQNQLEFTGLVFKDGNHWVSLCPEVDVASQGRTVREAKNMLAEAVSLYVEACFENGIPYFRPVPRANDPRTNLPEESLEIFPLKVDFKVHAFA